MTSHSVRLLTHQDMVMRLHLTETPKMKRWSMYNDITKHILTFLKQDGECFLILCRNLSTNLLILDSVQTITASLRTMLSDGHAQFFTLHSCKSVLMSQ